MTKDETKRVKELLGYLFSTHQHSFLKSEYLFDKEKSVEDEYWQLIEILKGELK